MAYSQQNPLTFMAVHAHPDDEVFGTGGTFAYLGDRGIRTVLVTATGGEEGEIVDPELDEQAKNELFPRLAEVRSLELEAAAKALRISELRNLGYRDSGMLGTPANDNPDCFHQALFDDAVKRLVSLIRELRPLVIATYDQFGTYGHPDHIQTHRATLAAFEAAGDPRCYPDLEFDAWQPSKLYYIAQPRSAMARMVDQMKAAGISGPWDNPEINMEAMGTADQLITTRLDVRAYVDHKLQAFRAHRTQIAPDGFMFKLPPEHLDEVLGFEYFVLARQAKVAHTGVFEYMFAGLA